jgi:hypothetical protein
MSQKKEWWRKNPGFRVRAINALVESQVIAVIEKVTGKTFSVGDLIGTREVKGFAENCYSGEMNLYCFERTSPFSQIDFILRHTFLEEPDLLFKGAKRLTLVKTEVMIGHPNRRELIPVLQRTSPHFQLCYYFIKEGNDGDFRRMMPNTEFQEIWSTRFGSTRFRMR